MQKVSVITINRNNSVELRKTIKSVIDQTYTNIEYIIIDGASTDDSVDVIKEYADSISYWVSEQDKGIYNAMNKGVEKSTGEYVIFMNSGDSFYSKNVLTNVFSIVQTADFLFGYSVVNGKRKNIKQTIPDNITFYHFYKYGMSHQATFTKKYLWNELGGYDENLSIVSDWSFAVKAIFLGNKSVATIKEYVALVDPTGVSGQDSSSRTMGKEKSDILNKYFGLFLADYKQLDKMKKFSLYNIRIHLIWRMRNFLIK